MNPLKQLLSPQRNAAAALRAVVGAVALWFFVGTAGAQGGANSGGAAAATDARAQTSDGPQKYAVLVGVGPLQDPLLKKSELYGTQNDVKRLRALLVDKYGFPAANVRTLEGAQSTKVAILDLVRDHLAAKMKAGDVGLFYFSGHGELVPARPQDKTGFLYKAFLPFDARMTRDPVQLDAASLLRNLELLDALKTVRWQDVTLIFDSCHSGMAARAGKGRIRRPGVAGSVITTASAPQPPPIAQELPLGPLVLTACRADQAAQEWPVLMPSKPVYPPGADADARDAFERRHTMGLLTYFLIETLRDDKDNRLSWREVRKKVEARIQERVADFGDPRRVEDLQRPEASGPLSRTPFAVPGGAPPPPAPKPPDP